MPVRVTVVVAVFDPGPAIDAVIDSVRAQTLGTDALELLLVDDGSTDGTGPRLEALARREPWVTYVGMPNSGWPSRPRNTGVARARGEHVLFLDHDDALFPEALERMLAAADRDGADIVLGKEVRTGGRCVWLEAYRHNRSQADLFADGLGDFTPHKLFRTAFLREHGLVFPEHLRRLEDHALLAAAYAHSPSVSVVADRACYRWNAHATSHSARLPDPETYYAALEHVLDLVDAWPHPEEVKDRARAFWLQTVVLERFGPRGYRTWPADYRPAFHAAARRVLLARFDPALDERVPASFRVRAMLLRSGDEPALLAWSEADSAVTTRPVLRAGEGAPGGLRLRLETTLVAHGTPVTFTDEDGGVRQVPSTPLPDDVARRAPEVDGELRRARVDVVLTERATHAEWFLPTRASHGLREADGALVWGASADAELLPATALMGSPLTPGIWDVRLRVAVLGYDSRPMVALAGCPPPQVEVGDLRVRPYATAGGHLAVRVSRRPRPPATPSRARRAWRRHAPAPLRSAVRRARARLAGR
ncbi:MAG TPA: glycosyltransferase family 2 protein [Pedococcus sp.]